MGQIRAVSPVKLLTGVITAGLNLLEEVKKCLEKEWGPADSESAILDFIYTRYYEAEMGSPLYRQFFSFQNLIDPGALATIKVFTNSLEGEFTRPGGKRQVNLDPGYLAPAKLVLATTKDRSHRIYLGQGIYAEVTLLYYRGQFEPLPWTYPDYRTEAYRNYFARVREIILRQGKGFLSGRGENS